MQSPRLILLVAVVALQQPVSSPSVRPLTSQAASDGGSDGRDLVDGLTAVLSAPWAFHGDQAGAALGWAVASAGDVNGDGYDDVIIGAPGYDRGQVDEGRITLHLGSASGPSAEPSWSAEGNQDFAQLGWAVAPAGDVNGDGYDDVIVGANLFDGGQLNEGRAYVWLGSRSGLRKGGGKSPNADWHAEPDQPGAQFGNCVAGAGDVNGDGYDDVLVGSWLLDGAHPDEGAVFLYLGSASGLSGAAAWTVRGGQAGAYLGFSVAGAGDVDADGLGDILVGAPFHDAAEADEGLVLLFLGSRSGISPIAAWAALGGRSLAQLGYSAAGAGDVNGDGYDDVILGARGFSDGELLEGRVLVHLGAPSGLDLAAAWVVESDQAFALMGYSVAGAGDVNGDGFDDVLVGADGFTGAFSSEGRASLFLGSPGGPGPQPAWSVVGGRDRAFLGRSVDVAGDVNRDGYADIILGADGYGGLLINAGLALVFTGPL